MTALLASVGTAAEALEAIEGGADIIDLSNAAAGALGAVSVSTLLAATTAVCGKRPLNTTLGNIPFSASAIIATAHDVARAGVTGVEIGLFPGASGKSMETVLQAVGQALGKRQRLIAVQFADASPDFSLLPALARYGWTGVALDTLGKLSGGLRSHLSDAAIARFIVTAHQLGLQVSLSGSLRLEDIAPLAALDPDVLGFRGAICHGGRLGTIDPTALKAVRTTLDAYSLIPVL